MYLYLRPPAPSPKPYTLPSLHDGYLMREHLHQSLLHQSTSKSRSSGTSASQHHRGPTQKQLKKLAWRFNCWRTDVSCASNSLSWLVGQPNDLINDRDQSHTIRVPVLQPSIQRATGKAANDALDGRRNSSCFWRSFRSPPRRISLRLSASSLMQQLLSLSNHRVYHFSKPLPAIMVRPLGNPKGPNAQGAVDRPRPRQATDKKETLM